MLTPEGVIKKKKLHNEISYTIVNIKESRKKRKTIVVEVLDELEESVESVEQFDIESE